MTAPRQETLARLTDNVVDAIAGRLGNDGVSLGDDFVGRINQVLGFPVEVLPTTTPSTTVNVGPTIYTLPDGQRVAVMDDGNLPSLAAGTINFATGTISTGANPTFALPSLTSGQFVKALIQYKIDENKLTVTFGTPALSQAGASIPTPADGYSAVALLELSAPSGTIIAIAKSAIIKIYGGFKSSKGLRVERQDVSGSPKTVFTLTSVVIPKNRSRLVVHVNGVLVDNPDDYAVTSDTVVTFVAAQPVNARVTFLVI